MFGTLRLIAVLTLVLPAIIFAYAAWQNRQEIEAQANERIERALDVLQEQALKALQTVELAISETNEVLRGMSDEEIRASESDLYLRLKRTQQALPQIEAIWAFDANGAPLVSSTILPVPRTLNNSDRSYFRVHKEGRLNTYISEVVQAKVGALRFFVLSGPRDPGAGGQFNGVIGVTVMPEHFTEFYRKLSRGRDSFVLTRADGYLLARFPETELSQGIKSSALPNALKVNSEAGSYTLKSPIDGVERRVGYRRVPGLDVYVQTGVDTAAISEEFWTRTLTQLALGTPAVLGMFLLALYALYRARRFAEEAARREAAETALKQAQRLEAIGQLTGGVAHDFNNLLMVVSGNLDRLRKHAAIDDKAKRAFDAIDMAVTRGTDLTRQLLSFSRRQTHEARVIDLGQALPAVREMLQSSLRSDITVATHVSPDLWPTRIDPSEFELTLLNLAVNARDAMPSGGNFTILARNVSLAADNPVGVEGDFVAVSAEDTGNGIRPELLTRVFEPFFTTKEVGKGTGLGLSQVYGFARQAGGTATIESEVGKGTRVTLYLPRSLDAPEVEAVLVAEPARKDAGPGGRILLVEDNPAVSEVTHTLLEELGYDVATATDVVTAIAQLKRDKTISIVLSDIVMPGGANGVDLARVVRSEYEGLPIVLATGFSESAQTATDEGFIILRKPYRADELREALDDARRNADLRPRSK